ncbi:MAG: response regulator [Chloroflexi bacterium]|nr:response regulator [Chloroflexota bacterium]
MSTVLLIDDNIALLENIADLLQLEDFAVITATRGLDGVSLARQRLPDLVICDIMLPDIDGNHVLKTLRADAACAETPFIFISAARTPRSYSAQSGVGYLGKPFTSAELLAVVRQFLDQQNQTTNTGLG